MTEQYDKKYNRKKLYWGSKPKALVVEIKKLLPKGAKILDLGCGEGQNANYLARNGFNVTAIDISGEGIKKADANAKMAKVQIKTEVSDIVDYIERKQKYDAIICMNALQFIPADKIKRVITGIQMMTRAGGYNIIVSFFAPDEMKRKQAIEKGRYLFRQKELQAYYRKWKIIKYNEQFGKWETHGEPRHRHYLVWLVAKKSNLTISKN